jgi:sterol 14-demethylase
MWYYYLSVCLVLFWWFLLRPRGGGKDSPPLITASTVIRIPLFGVIAEFLKSPNDMMKRCYKDYGPVFTIPIFNQRITFLIGPEAQSLFFKSGDDVLSQDECYHFMQAVFGPGVVYDAPRKKRQMQFQTMANGLRTSRMKTYVPKIEEETLKYLDERMGDESGTIDLYKCLSELTILTASRCLHGDDVREHMFKDLQALYHDLDKGLTPLTVLWSQAPTARHKRRNEARKELVQLFGKVIKLRRENPERSDGTDILSLFMDMKYKDGTPVSEEEVTGLLIALLFAGQHTSCVSSTWTVLFLLHNPKILDRVMEEQVQFGSKNGLQLDDVQQMSLLHNCMREALRLCPTFIMLLRQVMKDTSVTVNGKTHRIPKDDLVAVSPTVSMRLDSTFKNADAFDPDRYFPPREEHKTPYAYLGFGGGMHSCMGEKFAYVQVKAIISILLHRYELTPEASKMPDIGYNDMVVGPKGNCNVHYKKKKVV